MLALLSVLLDNLPEIYKIECTKDTRKEKISNQYAVLLALKLINYVLNTKNVKKYGQNQ